MNLKYTATIADEMKLELFKKFYYYSPYTTIEKSFFEAVRQTEEIWGKLINGTEENNNVGRHKKNSTISK